ncbi:unnamed protein product [Closterium sp. NIES-65]|nr:unnamed protein product [Closterium sp. NIES-65]
MEPATSPYSPVRCSARSTAGVPAPSDDMVYYGPGTSSPRPNARHARGPSPSAAGARRDDPDTDTEYLPWADRQDERLDVEDDDEEEDNWMPEEEPVDEDAEGNPALPRDVAAMCTQAQPIISGRSVDQPMPLHAFHPPVRLPPSPPPPCFAAEQREVRPLSEVIASSTQATSKEQRPGGRGPTLNRRGTASANAPGNPGAALDNAIAGRVAKQEQRIHELNQTIERLEGNRATAARSASPRATNRPSRARDAAVDEPAPCRQHTAAGRAVVEDMIKILTYDTSVAQLTFWMPPSLLERLLARALRITSPAHRTMLHMLLAHDEKRAGWITRQMQVWRNTKWEHGRTYVYILHGLPYKTGSSPRISLPATPSALEVPRISGKQFIEHFPAGPASFELHPWHRNAAGIPYATEKFERAIFVRTL